MHKWLLSEPDEDDLIRHAERCDPELLTRRCHEIVPVIGFVGGRVVETGLWGATGEIPLLEGPMNQNAIQLASNHYLLADWIAAIGVLSVLPGVTAIGFHDPDQSAPMQVWTVSGSIEHLAAGTGTITTTWRPERDEITRIRRDIVATGQATFQTIMDVYQDARVVSRVSLTQMVLVTNPRAVGQPTNMIQAHAHKVSALLIAGLRKDELSQEVAGQQGRALAERMSKAMPQLPTMVRARTTHLDDLISEPGRFSQVLVVGIGLDTRPLRLDTQATWFGVDLEPGIKNRVRHFKEVEKRTGKADPTRLVAADVRDVGWLDKICDSGFDPKLPTLVVVEGLSMYLTAEELEGLSKRLAIAVESPESRLWVDHVTRATLETRVPEARDFLSTMARMGEPFILGFESLDEISSGVWRTEAMANSAEVSGIQDSLLDGYRFSVMSRAR